MCIIALATHCHGGSEDGREGSDLGDIKSVGIAAMVVGAEPEKQLRWLRDCMASQFHPEIRLVYFISAVSHLEPTWCPLCPSAVAASTAVMQETRCVCNHTECLPAPQHLLLKPAGCIFPSAPSFFVCFCTCILQRN